MRDDFSRRVGLRYAGVQAQTHLLGFLARMAMTGLVLGTALLIVVLSVMNGFDRELRERILDLVPHIAFYNAVPTGADPTQQAIDWDALENTLRADPAVRDVVRFNEVDGMLKSRDTAEPLVFYGVEDYPALEEYLSADALQHWKHNPTGLLVGQYLAERLHLKVDDEVIGLLSMASGSRDTGSATPGDFLSKTVLQRFQVAGIFDTKTELDKALVIAHPAVLQAALGIQGAQGFRLRLHDLFRAPVVEWQLLQKLPANFYGRNWSQTQGNLYEAVQMSRSLVSLLMFVIIAVAVFNIVSTLMMVVMEKKQSIAILRVQGATRWQIIRIFVVQGTAIGLAGSGLGALLGMLVSWALPGAVSGIEQAFHFHFLKTEVYPISYIPSDLRMTQVMVVVLVATLFSFITSLYPAWRATRIDPAQVLRYE
jgi:lipoprotein-releasing system permease protein